MCPKGSFRTYSLGGAENAYARQDKAENRTVQYVQPLRKKIFFRTRHGADWVIFRGFIEEIEQ